MEWKLKKESVKRYFSWSGYLLLAAVINFVIESMSRHSVLSALEYLKERPMVYLYNTLLIAVCYLAVYLVRRKPFATIIVSCIWLVAGISNGMILANRVTPLTGPDLRMITDALSIANLYLKPSQGILTVGGIAVGIVVLAVLYRKLPRHTGEMFWKRRLIVTALTIAGFAMVTQTAIEKRVISTFFSNVAYAYQDYGFPYCFTTSVFAVGMSTPHGYSKQAIEEIIEDHGEQTGEEEQKKPNIIFVQLETFFDPTLLKNIELSEDPIPNFHRYMNEYSSGYFEVPSVGAGTANTEFETIVGMNLHYFGPGEYPYKTILKKKTCDSMAFALKNIGYTAHALHNNTARFYGRNVVFSNLGFDTFTPVETMSYVERNELDWADDSVLTEYIMDCLDSSKGPDYVYAISVQGHGAYPEEPVLEDPVIRVTKAENEARRNQWEYYVNQLYEMDQFVEELISAVKERDEETVIVMYGDHLPTMDLKASDMKNGHLYSTEYFIWDNIGLEKKDKNIATYQMGATVTNRLGIHEGTMMRYHQNRQGTKYYMQDMEMLQYDMLYGKKYAFGGKNPFVATNIKYGIRNTYLSRVEYTNQGRAYVFGKNFTKHSRVYINGKKKKPQFLNDKVLILKDVQLEKGDEIVVKQMASKDTILQETRTYTIH